MGILAFVLIKLKAGRAEEVLKTAKLLPAVKQAYMVTGIYDIIVTIRAKDLKELGEIVAEKIHEVDGVSSTVTCIVVA
ncbi:Lrp/AsnC ligand binding domain-containing protein [candidate division WOR-3 bacterium]|nr:Lrp/AsnC ligand binding domain-containing protein [candidate division WOR-3 bacterium]